MDTSIFVADPDALAARIPDGAMVAVGKTETGPAMAVTRALIRRGVRDLHLVCVPSSGLQADLLIGAGAVRIIECAAVSMGEFGQAPAFGRAIHEGKVEVRDSTCPAIYAGIQAGEKGIPFMAIRGLIGSDVAAHRSDFKVIGNPFDPADPIMVVKAIRPDVALIHAPLADREGNVWIGRHGGLMAMAHAARATLVSVERICEESLLDDPDKGPATIPALYLDAIAEVPRGAWPAALTDRYEEDAEHMRRYLRLAATPEGFAQYLETEIHARSHAAQ